MSFKTIVFTSNFYPCRTQPNLAEDAALWKSNLNKLDQKRASAKQCLQSTAKYNAASEHRTQKILHRLMKQQSILASRHLRPAKYANLIFFPDINLGALAEFGALWQFHGAEKGTAEMWSSFDQAALSVAQTSHHLGFAISRCALSVGSAHAHPPQLKVVAIKNESENETTNPRFSE